MPPPDETIHQRLALLETYVVELRDLRERTLDELQTDLSLAWSVEHGLQLATQCVIDVCHILVASRAWARPRHRRMP